MSPHPVQFLLVLGVALLTAGLLARVTRRTLSDTAGLESRRQWVEWAVFAVLTGLSVLAAAIIIGLALAVQLGVY